MNTLKTHFCASSFCVFFWCCFVIFVFLTSNSILRCVHNANIRIFNLVQSVMKAKTSISPTTSVENRFFTHSECNLLLYTQFSIQKKKVNLKKKKLHFSSHSILCLHKASINLVELLQMNFVIYHVATIQWLIIYQVYRKIKRNFCFFAL